MTGTLSLFPSSGNHASADLPPVDPKEFNDEIYWYLTQLHQRQMQQRAPNIAIPQVPSDVQQVQNLDTAFLRFSRKLVEGSLAEQIECEKCQRIYEDWLAISPLLNDRAQILSATTLLDGLVDAHASHSDADEAGFCYDAYDILNFFKTALLAYV
jgi:hypothetical protein